MPGTAKIQESLDVEIRLLDMHFYVLEYDKAGHSPLVPVSYLQVRLTLFAISLMFSHVSLVFCIVSFEFFSAADICYCFAA